MRAKVLLWLAVCCCAISTARAQLYIYGADVSIRPMALVFVDSNVVYAGGLQQTIEHMGTLEVTGNWYNLSASDKKVFTDTSAGMVTMLGALQTFNGNNTRFPNLTLGGNRGKQLFTNIEIRDTLNLADKELDVNGYTVAVLSNDVNAILYDANGFGHINTSASKNGWLIRNVKRGMSYTYPLGDNLGSVSRFRPLLITPQQEGNIYGQFQNYNPQKDNYFPTLTDGSMQSVNEQWYHSISTDGPGVSANVSIFYHSTQDGNFAGMGGWNSSTLKWNNIPAVSQPRLGTVVNMEMGTTAPINIAASVANPIALSKSKQIDFLIPNVITPNGDGKNDQLIIRGLDPTATVDIVIFNRWGNVVYRNARYDNRWDATGLNAGTYFYEVKVTDASGAQRSYKGSVLVMK